MNKSYFALYLKRAGYISGPCRKCTRHSDLSVMKSWLEGRAISFKFKAHNRFGRAVHYEFLLRKRTKEKINKEERRDLRLMVDALNKHAVVRKIMALCPVREKRRPVILNGVKVKFTPDAHGKLVMADLKTTVCRSLREFILKAIEYGYFRQGYQYSIAVGVKQYWIIGIQKQKPFKVFLVLIHEHKEIMAYVARELEFLLYFFKNYGNPIYKRKKSAQSNTRGKE